MLICGILCVVKAIQHPDSPIFSRMIISLISTYGIYIVSSILALDPWHMFTCFFQYLLFMPTYTNVLQIYAYANLHDLSWGTKGSDTVEDDLGAVKGVGKHVEVAVVSGQVDIDSQYQDALDNLRTKGDKLKIAEMPKRNNSAEQRQKDIYANFRTDLLLVWTLSNALLASLILTGVDTSNTFTGSGSRTTVYMLVILVSVAAMALFRFICATLYLIIRLFTGV
jgi:chitin synthase